MGNILNALSLNRMSSMAVQARAAFDDNDLMKLTDDSMGGRLVFGLQVTAIGLSIVFAVLIGLWLLLTLSGTIFQRLANRQAGVAESVPETISAPEPVSEIEITEEPEEDEEELISVLTAAIAASIQKPVTGFRVVSFKQRGAWKNGG